MKNLQIGRVLGCLLVFGVPAANAQTVYEKNEYEYGLVEEAPIESEIYEPELTFIEGNNGTIIFYGQINLAYQSFDDGERNTHNIVDNGNWNSRIGLMGSQDFDYGTLRFRLETGLGLRSSAAVWQQFTPDWTGWALPSMRWFEVSSESSIGTISLGHGSSASDGTAGLDDSFTFHGGATDSSDGFGSFRFRDENGDLTSVTVGQVNSNFNGARRFRARYDTPVVGGFMFSTSYGINVLVPTDETKYYDVALRWNGEIGDFAIRSAIGYQWLDDPNGDNTRRLAGSISAVHVPTGLNGAFSAGEQIDGASYYWARAGLRQDFFSFGTTSLSVDYYHGSDFLTDGARTENYGVYAVQTIDALSVDLYASWRRFTYGDRTGVDYQDADGILAGARWFF